MPGSSTGQIAASLGIPTYRVEWIVKSRKIQPEFRAGNVRVFGPAAVQQIREALASMKPKPKAGASHATV